MALTKWAQEYEAECRERAMIWRGGKLAMQAEGGDFGDPDGYDREGLLAELDATRASLDDERERAQHNMDMAKDYMGELWSVRGKRAEEALDATRARVASLEADKCDLAKLLDNERARVEKLQRERGDEMERNNRSWGEQVARANALLAATQAERDEARAALERLASYERFTTDAACDEHDTRVEFAQQAIARPVGSVEALRSLLERAAEEGLSDGRSKSARMWDPENADTLRAAVAHIVARLLPADAARGMEGEGK